MIPMRSPPLRATMRFRPLAAAYLRAISRREEYRVASISSEKGANSRASNEGAKGLPAISDGGEIGITRSGETSAVPASSHTSVAHFTPTHRPEQRESA